MATSWLEKLKTLLFQQPPYCKQCGREETRQEWIKKSQCSMCCGPLTAAKDRDRR
jgi:predicted Zn-ribbon and HTH transcriptional regulator